MRRICVLIFVVAIFVFSCKKHEGSSIAASGSRYALRPLAPGNENQHVNITTGKTTPAELLTYACSLNGTPYKYGSIDPQQGFDCSGYVTCVFNHFEIRVPRPSVDFTYVNQVIDIEKAKPGDLILFTGTDSATRVVGHIGIVVSNKGDDLIFIHATSGKGYGVTETPLTPYYQERYLKIIRVFKQNDR